MRFINDYWTLRKKRKKLILIVSFKETHEWVEIQDALVTYQR